MRDHDAQIHKAVMIDGKVIVLSIWSSDLSTTEELETILRGNEAGDAVRENCEILLWGALCSEVIR